jgi:hypothetical protein
MIESKQVICGYDQTMTNSESAEQALFGGGPRCDHHYSIVFAIREATNEQFSGTCICRFRLPPAERSKLGVE